MEELITVTTIQRLKEIQEYLEKFDYISFDTETTGLDKESKIIGFSVSAEVNTGIYCILSYWDKEQQKLIDMETTEYAKEFMQFLATKQLVMHNSVFDCIMVNNNFGVDLMASLHTDTMILAHILDENRSVGLKDLGVSIFGEKATKEKEEMNASISANGGTTTRGHYELYKGDAELIAKYGAKDALLTLNLFYHLVPELYEQQLDQFFYEDESMPLLRGPTYSLNTAGLKIDSVQLMDLKKQLEAECLELKAFIYDEITPHVKNKYPGKSTKDTFNLNSGSQLAWLLFCVLGNEFHLLTDAGRELCQGLQIKVPYSSSAKREFIELCRQNRGEVYQAAKWNPKTKKMGKPKTVKDWWNYLSTGKATMEKLSSRHKWVDALMKYSKNMKILTTYCEGIQNKVKYNIIYPSFLQHGTTSGRYSSRDPNFQNLPRKDNRIKKCVVSRDGKVFVGADYSQLEPRVFASVSKDETLLQAFKDGKDFYSVVGVPIFEVPGCSLYKDDENSFANKHPKLRDLAKAFALATPYGTSAFRQAQALDKPTAECQEIIDKYFEAYPKVELMMLESHEIAKRDGVVYNLYGRPRRIPDAKQIKEIYGNADHKELPYAARSLLNLAMNHRVQSSAASIVNRSAIACWNMIKTLAKGDSNWNEVKIVLQVHDEIVLEGPEVLADDMVTILKDAMENTVKLPGIDLIADPKVAKNLADLK